jgi:UDP-N-acetylmuramyl pentapeptide phosphotransferase/UDP-N-acetylglucosamine-1-phosphate transferase
MLTGVSILGLTKSTTVLAIFLPLLILAVPLFDRSTVILTRLQRGKSPFNPDNNHLHHRLLRAGLSHRLTVLTIYAMTLWAGSLAIAVVGLPVGWIIWASATGLLGCSSWKIWQAMRS